MRDLSCKLIRKTIQKNNIGVENEIVTQKEIIIKKIEDIYANEFYKANEQGFKPSLRLRISVLSYNNENELIYQNKEYTIIRTQEVNADEIVLVCQRKVKNG